MKIGIVSDSHGRSAVLRRALQTLVDHGAELLVHCGDVGNPDCLAALAEWNLPAYAVAGNTDSHLDVLMDEARMLGVEFAPELLNVPLGDGSALAVMHGNHAGLMMQCCACGHYRYVCHGHTHRTRDEYVGATHVINPGALYNTNCPTVALLDTASDEVIHFAIPLE